MEIVEKEISSDKRYLFPSNLEFIEYGGKWIVVSVFTANWIILENPSQLEFFRLLQKFNIGEALSKFEGKEDDAQWVVVQLEARQFEEADVFLKQSEPSVHMYLTNGCNMRCPHCYMFAGEKLEEELSQSEILRVIEELSESGIKSIVFSGGEPLLNPGFRKYVEFAGKSGVKVEVLTNGTLWTDDLIKELAPYLSRVQISIDGFDEESNAKIRGKGNFEKSLRTADTLIKQNVPVSIAMVPKYDSFLRNNTHKYVTFVRELIDKYKDYPFTFNIVGDIFEGRNLNLTDSEKLDFKRIVSEIFTNIYGPNSEDQPFIEYHKRHGVEENCAFGNLSIAANGDVYLCAQIHPLQSVGNIRTSTTKELLNISKKAKENSEVSKLDPCGECAVRYICGGECRIKYFSYFTDGILPVEGESPKRLCTEEYRNSIYDLMIRTNEEIFQ